MSTSKKSNVPTDEQFSTEFRKVVTDFAERQLRLRGGKLTFLYGLCNETSMALAPMLEVIYKQLGRDKALSIAAMLSHSMTDPVMKLLSEEADERFGDMD